jgi:hypothetical protein
VYLELHGVKVFEFRQLADREHYWGEIKNAQLHGKGCYIDHIGRLWRGEFKEGESTNKWNEELINGLKILPNMVSYIIKDDSQSAGPYIVSICCCFSCNKWQIIKDENETEPLEIIHNIDFSSLLDDTFLNKKLQNLCPIMNADYVKQWILYSIKLYEKLRPVPSEDETKINHRHRHGQRFATPQDGRVHKHECRPFPFWLKFGNSGCKNNKCTVPLLHWKQHPHHMHSPNMGPPPPPHMHMHSPGGSHWPHEPWWHKHIPGK